MTSTLRGEGVPSKADIESNLSKGGCVNLRTRGGGFKISEIVADIINGSPLMKTETPAKHIASSLAFQEQIYIFYGYGYNVMQIRFVVMSDPLKSGAPYSLFR